MTECAHCGVELPADMLDDCAACSSLICAQCAELGECDAGPSPEDDRRANPREMPE